MPHWRFERDGAEAVAAELSGWYGAPDHHRVRGPRARSPAARPSSSTCSWVEDGVPHAAHQLHLLAVDGGRITPDTVFCGGRWPAALLAEMEAARGH